MSVTQQDSFIRRPRPIVTCQECRRKRIKCDRTYPCLQCTKTGHPEICVFVPQEVERVGVRVDKPNKQRRQGSCLECRRKKQKCDKEQPCDQCSRARKPRECVYQETPYSGEDSNVSSVYVASYPTAAVSDVTENYPANGFSGGRNELDKPRTDTDGFGVVSASRQRPSKRQRTSQGVSVNESGGAGEVQDLQLRVKRLEELLARDGGDHRNGASRQSSAFTDAASDRGTDYRDGYSPRPSLPSPFDEARNFLRKLHDDQLILPYIQRIRQNQRSLASAEHYSTGSREQKARPQITIPTLIDVLPRKETCDVLVELYCRAIEKTNRVLHAPTFLSQYQEFWAKGQVGAPFGFVAQLVAVIASATSPSLPFQRDDGLKLPHPRRLLLEAIEHWHENLKRKERLTVTAFQTKLIVFLSSHSASLPGDKTWDDTGSLVRYAMSIGLHRDPSRCRDVSVLQGEVRRRLWATVLELDLQASLVSGMPTAVRDNDWDTAPPDNLDDEQLTEGLDELPMTASLDTWTDSLLQVVLSQSLDQRMRTAVFISSIDQGTEYERLAHSRAIEQLLAEIPSVAKVEAVQSPYGNDESNGVTDAQAAANTLGRAVLDINIRRALLYLCRPSAMRQVSSDSESFSRARRICRDSALAILSRQETFGVQCRHDILLACLVLCWEVKLASSSGSIDETYDSAAASPSPGWTKARLIRTVEDALKLLSQRLDERGSLLEGVLGLSVVLQSVKSNASLEWKVEMMRDAAVAVMQDFLDRAPPDGVTAASKAEEKESERGQPQARTDGTYDDGHSLGSDRMELAEFLDDGFDFGIFGAFGADLFASNHLSEWSDA